MTALNSTLVKRCSRCKSEKPATLEHFCKKLEKLTSQCKPCLRECKAATYDNAKSEINARRRQKRKTLSPEELGSKRQLDRERYLRRKEAGDPSLKKEYTDKVKARQRKYYEANKASMIQKSTEYVRKNKDRTRERMREYTNRRHKEDALFGMARRTRALPSISLRNRGFYKSEKTESMLGCSLSEFFTHLESQFAPGMSWSNRNEWHVDHIVPLASASTENEIIRLNHYENLRPLWAADNIRKGCKMPTRSNFKEPA